MTLNMDDVNAFAFIQQMKYTEYMGRDNENNVDYPKDLKGANKERKRVLDVNECVGLPTLSQRMKRQRTDG